MSTSLLVLALFSILRLVRGVLLLVLVLVFFLGSSIFLRLVVLASLVAAGTLLLLLVVVFLVLVLVLLVGFLALLQTLLLGLDHVHPLILALVFLMVDLLLDDVLVLRVVGVDVLDRLPAALALCGVHTFESERCDHDGHCETLGVDTRLHEFLLSGQVGVAADEGESAAHGCDPGAEDD